MAEQATDHIRTTAKAVEIIEALRDLDGAGVTEVAQHLGYNKSTVHHHLTTLVDKELVRKRGDDYELGIRLFELGEHARQRRPIYPFAKPEADSLAEETGEIANVMVEEHGRGVYLHVAEGNQAVNLDTSVGSKQYLHACALGKAMLAEMDRKRVEAIIDRHGLPQQTPNTVTDRATLFEELEEIRGRGVAFDGEERAQGIRCVATAVTDRHDRLLGAISVSAPASRMKGERLHEEIPERVENAAEIAGINASYS